MPARASICIVAMFSTLLALPAVAGETVGVRDVSIAAAHRGRDITATYWYPATSGEGPSIIGANGVFQGVPTYTDAPLAMNHRLPAVLVSHGGFRSAPNIEAWIAARLASRGYFVAVPHPPAQGDRAADAALELWMRPLDLSAVLTAMEGDPEVAAKVETRSAAVLGLFLGGSAALQLVGGRVDEARFVDHCAEATDTDCRWFAAQSVDPRVVARSAPTAAAPDERIASVVIVEPELTSTLSPTSLAAVRTPVTVIKFERDAGDERPSDDHRAVAYPPGTRHVAISGGSRFDLFALCKPTGAAILKEEGGDDRLCGGGAEIRSDVHDGVEAAILAAFESMSSDRR